MYQCLVSEIHVHTINVKSFLFSINDIHHSFREVPFTKERNNTDIPGKETLSKIISSNYIHVSLYIAINTLLTRTWYSVKQNCKYLPYTLNESDYIVVNHCGNISSWNYNTASNHFLNLSSISHYLLCIIPHSLDVNRFLNCLAITHIIRLSYWPPR